MTHRLVCTENKRIKEVKVGSSYKLVSINGKRKIDTVYFKNGIMYYNGDKLVNRMEIEVGDEVVLLGGLVSVGGGHYFTIPDKHPAFYLKFDLDHNYYREMKIKNILDET